MDTGGVPPWSEWVKPTGLGPRLVAGEARDGGGIGIPPPASKTATEGLYA